MGRTFDRKRFLQYLEGFIQRGYGSYKELISLSMRDLIEIKISIESKQQEEQLNASLSNPSLD